jgi:hypothetical protein
VDPPKTREDSDDLVGISRWLGVGGGVGCNGGKCAGLAHPAHRRGVGGGDLETDWFIVLGRYPGGDCGILGRGNSRGIDWGQVGGICAG